ncbi:MAG: Rieske (2Fe-2S) protein [Pseudonocardia sp.]|nr:Rieske (2Fe-2S) protein [Pseudonocardia sp.]
MAKNVVVASVDEVPPGSRKIVDVDGRSIGIFNIDGDYFAVRNTCPHAGGPLCQGVTSGIVTSTEPGSYEYRRRGEFLRCPWHQWEFDIRTGQSWLDPAKTRVRRYDVKVKHGCELLATDGATDSGAEMAGMLKGRYVAETYRVVVDQDYIVLSL